MVLGVKKEEMNMIRKIQKFNEMEKEVTGKKTKILRGCMAAVGMVILLVAVRMIYVNTREYRYTEYDDSVTITKYQGNSEVVVIPPEINGKPVHIIDDAAFADCKKITSVSIPEGVWRIGDSAFSNCEKLTNTVIPESVSTIEAHAFEACSSLSGIAMPPRIVTIGDGIFDQCENLTWIAIYDSMYNHDGYDRETWLESVGELGYEDFDEETRELLEESKSLLESYEVDVHEDLELSLSVDKMIDHYPGITEIFYYNDFPDGIEIVGYEGTETSVVIPPEIIGRPVTEIGRGAFAGNEDMNHAVIPDSVTKIGMDAFTLCVNLREITIPDSVTEIQLSAFSLSGLEQMIIPNRVTEIAPNAFKGCTRLSSVTIPDSVRKIGFGAFSLCLSLEEITIPDSVAFIEDSAFEYCEKLIKITVPNGITRVAAGTFSYCTSLEEITLPESVTEIDILSFLGCSSLRKIEIPNGVTKIPVRAFALCTSLSELYIPDSVVTIGTEAFGLCENLENVTVPEHTSIASTAFEGCTNLVLHKRDEK